MPIRQPKGAMISLDGIERSRLLKLRGDLTQAELGSRAGVSAGTISNIETGTGQVKVASYIKLLRALRSRRPPGSKDDQANREAVAQIAEDAAILELDDLEVVRTMVAQLAKARKPKDT